jgi:hypothetical protein
MNYLTMEDLIRSKALDGPLYGFIKEGRYELIGRMMRPEMPSEPTGGENFAAPGNEEEAA